MISYKNTISDLEKIKNLEKIETSKRFFKTGKGEYGEGDEFLGISVPQMQSISKKYINLDLKNIKRLLESKYHEARTAALTILTYKFENYKKEKNINELKNIFDFYLQNTEHINNWDLVDLSCYKIVGDYLLDKDRSILHELSKSKSLWERRISVVSTFAFIKNHEYKDTTKICEQLLNDKEELIHKATGWMLREVGKKTDKKILLAFLNKNYKKMPRTMLRYSIERLSSDEKLFFMKK